MILQQQEVHSSVLLVKTSLIIQIQKTCPYSWAQSTAKAFVENHTDKGCGITGIAVGIYTARTSIGAAGRCVEFRWKKNNLVRETSRFNVSPFTCEPIHITPTIFWTGSKTRCHEGDCVGENFWYTVASDSHFDRWSNCSLWVEMPLRNCPNCLIGQKSAATASSCLWMRSMPFSNRVRRPEFRKNNAMLSTPFCSVLVLSRITSCWYMQITNPPNSIQSTWTASMKRSDLTCRRDGAPTL